MAFFRHGVATRLAAIALGLVALMAHPAGGGAVRQIVRADDNQPDLLTGAWQPYQKAFPFTRTGDVFVCDNGPDAMAQGGLCQTVLLNQTAPHPIIASAWSKAQDVGGEANTDYALYLDLVYVDGEPLWDQSAPFAVGTHDWQRVEVRVTPAKPVKQVTFYLLFRSHSGTAQFRGPRLCELSAGPGAALLDGLCVEAAGPGRGEGFWVRDVAADSDFVSLDGGEALGLRLDVTRTARGPASFFAVRLTDTTGTDRAVTLLYTAAVPGGRPRSRSSPEASEPLRAPASPMRAGRQEASLAGWRWLASPRQELAAESPQEYAAVSRFAATGTGRLSRYPLAAVAKAEEGRAIALDLSRPAFFRVGYAAGSEELYLACDLGLAPEKPSADFAFATFPFAGAWGFRGAVAGLYELFPDCFRCRTPRQGPWMPFYPISKVEGWQDFGFAFKEGNDETAWDDAHDILTFRYTEPMTWWMRMPKEMPRTLDAALAEAERLAATGDSSAQALLTSGHHDAGGRLVARLLNEPWCDGAVWSVNSSPGIRGEVTDFKNKWNAELRERLYGPARTGDLDGEYVDSSEGYVTAELDFRRDHLAAARLPLAFSAEGFRPAVFRGLIAAEYIDAIAEDVHGMGKLTMANGTPGGLCWLAPSLDVMGTETDWNRGNTWRPMSDEELLYRRVLCGPKPYCFLMNTDFAAFSHGLVEKYMKRCLAYGMFPGFFSHNASEGHYFSQPALYNRDRDLFKKYVPLCRRVAEAGWQPVTRARSDNPKVYVERFGDNYLTVFNDTGQKQDLTITLDGLTAAKARDLIEGTDLTVTDGGISLSLEPEDVAVMVLE